MMIHDDNMDWDYIGFNKAAGAAFKPCYGNLPELIFVRRPEFAAI